MRKIMAFLAVLLAMAATSYAQHSATLSWTPSTTTDVTSQQVLRSGASGGPYTDIVPTLGSGLAGYIDAMVTAGQTYYYVLTATDPNGVSAFSNEAVAVIPGGVVPPPPPPTGTSVYLRYGSTATYTDPSGNVWKAGTCPISTASATHAVTKTTTQPLYQAECYGKTFSIKVTGLAPSAPYTLTLKLDEPYWNAAGARIFSVTSQGAAWLTNLDLWKDAGGEFIADDKVLAVTADTTGAVTLGFTTTTDNATINALSLVPSGPAPPPITLGINCVVLACSVNEQNVPSGTKGTINVTLGGATASTTVAVP